MSSQTVSSSVPSSDVDSTHVGADWREADAALTRIAHDRGKLDAEEAGWLVAAQRTNVHRHVGCATMLEYLERVLGYSPRVALERLRIAEALAELPLMHDALAAGQLALSGVRELTRVAVPATEAAWLEAAAGKTVRQIEGMVAGRRHGDTPDSDADPSLMKRVVRFEVSAETYALLREAKRRVADDLGHPVDDDQLWAELARAVLGGSSDEGRAPHQIAITTCDRCQRVFQDAAGEVVEVEPAVLGRARCDAQEIGETHVGTRKRATQTIPPATRREVFRRDHGRCVVPGCRSARHLEIHHIIPREQGGTHEPPNLVLTCGGHHRAHHKGALGIEGTTGALRFSGLPRPPDARVEDAVSALRNLRVKDADARQAIDAASAQLAPEATMQELLRAAFGVLRGSVWALH